MEVGDKMKKKIKFLTFLLLIVSFGIILNFKNTKAIKAESDNVTLNGVALTKAVDGTYLIDEKDSGKLVINGTTYVEKVEDLTSSSGFNDSIRLIPTQKPSVYLITSVTNGWNENSEVSGAYESFKMRDKITDISKSGVVSKTMILTTTPYLGFMAIKSAPVGGGNYAYGLLEIENATFEDPYNYNYGVNSFSTLQNSVNAKAGGYNEYFFTGDGVHSVMITYTGNSYTNPYMSEKGHTYKCYIYDIITEREYFDATFSYDERLGKITIKQAGSSLLENGYSPKSGEIVKIAKNIEYSYEVRPKTSVNSTIDESRITGVYITSSLLNYWQGETEKWGDCYSTNSGSEKTWQEGGFSITLTYTGNLTRKHKVEFEEIIVIPDEAQEVMITEDGIITNEKLINGSTINVNFLADVSVSLASKVIKGTNCVIYLNGKLLDETLQIENDNYYFKLLSVKLDYTVEFRYLKDGYRYNSFIYNIVSAPINEFVGEDAINQYMKKYLAVSGSENLTFITNVTYNKYGNTVTADNFIFNSGLMDDESIVFASNKSADYTTAILGIKALADGALNFEFKVDGAPYTSTYGTSCYGYYAKNTFTLGEYARDNTYTVEDPSSLDKGSIGFISGNLKDSCHTDDWLTFNVYLKKDEIIYIAYNCSSDFSAKGTSDKLAIRNVKFSKNETVEVMYEVTNGEVEASVEGVNFTTATSAVTGQKATFKVTPNSGKTFYYWLYQELDENGDVINSKVISKESEFTFYINTRCKLIPVIENTGKFEARIGDIYYESVTLALENAKNGDVVIVLEDLTLKSDLLIPSKITLLLPYNIKDEKGYSVGKVNVTRPSWGRGVEPYVTLTISENVKLTVEGTLIVGGVQHAPNQASQGMTSGDYSKIINNGQITINGSMDVRGEVTGNGALTLNKGALLKEPFMVDNFSGGSNTSNLYNSGQFPFVQYSTSNIKCQKIINYGSVVIGTTSLYFWGSVHTQDVILIDKIENRTSASEGSLLWLHEGSRLEITYDGKSIKEQVGNINLSDSGLNYIKVFGTVTAGEFYLQGYGSKNMHLSLPYTYQFEITRDAKIIISQKYKIMPGSVVQILDGGTLDITKNGELLVYNGLIQGSKSGKKYPSATLLEKYNFDQVGMLINDGTLLINGRFLGLIQTTSNTGIIQTSLTSNLETSEILDGSNGDYTDNRSIFTLSAEVYEINGRIKLENNKTYKAYNGDTFLQSSYVMTYYEGNSGSSTCHENYTVMINQSLSGRFLEYIDGNYYANVTFDIMEKVKNVRLIINGDEYYTDENGTVTVFVKVSDISYLCDGDVEENIHRIDVTLDDNTVLDEVVKSFDLLDSNIYEKIYDKDNKIVQDFVLKARIVYYGNKEKVIDLSANEDPSKIVMEDAELSNPNFSLKVTVTLYIQHAIISAYIDECENLKYEADVLSRALNLYESYQLLRNNRSNVELSYLENLTTHYQVYTKMVKELIPTTVTYGDPVARLNGTTIAGDSVVVEARTTGYNVSGSNISSVFVYNGEYFDSSYKVYVQITNVNVKKVTLTVDDKQSIYGDPLQELTGTMELVNNDTINNVVQFVKASGNVPGTYQITAIKTHPGYDVMVENGTYTITKRKINVEVLDHKDVMKGSSGIISDIETLVTGSVDDNYRFGFELYQNGSYIAYIDHNGVVSVTLDIGKYTIKPILESSCYEIESYTEGNIEILIDNTYYDVQVDFMDGNTKITEKVYDGIAIVPIIKVVKHDTGEVVTSGVTYEIVGGETIKKAGNYTINVTVNGVEYAGAGYFVITKRVANITLDHKTLVYNGFAQTPKFVINNVISDDNVEVETEITSNVVVGTYTVSALSLKGDDANNYMLLENSKDTYRIIPLEIEVVVNQVTQIYGNVETPLSVNVLTDLPTTDNITSIIRLEKEAGTSVGSYDITASVINDNYNVIVSGEKDAYTITRKDASVIIDSKTSVYGDVIETLTGTIKGLIKEDENLDVNKLYKLSKELGVNVGSYVITGENISENYNITFVNGTYSITPAQLSVFVDDATSIYGDKLKDITVNIVSGTLKYNDNINNIVTVTKETGINAGKYKITASNNSSNYDITFTYTSDDYSVYEILRRSITIQLDHAVITNKMSYQEVKNVLTYQITSGEVVLGDNLNLTIYLVINDHEITESNYHKYLCGGVHLLKARYDNANYDITIIENSIEVIRPQVSVVNIKTTYEYTGKEIMAFNYRNNIDGYLESASEASFRAWYYVKGDETKTPVSLTLTGTYIMVVEIVHTVSYEFSPNAQTEFEITVFKKDISNLLVIEGIEKENYVIINTINRPFAFLPSEYDLTLQDVLTKDGLEVTSITTTGSYEYKVAIIDDNYQGEKTIKFEVINNLYETVKRLNEERIYLERLRGKEIIERANALYKKIEELTDVERLLIDNNKEYASIINSIITRTIELNKMYQDTLNKESLMMELYSTLNPNDFTTKYEIYKNINPLDEIARSFIDSNNLSKLDEVVKEIITILERTSQTLQTLNEKLNELETTSNYVECLLSARNIASSFTSDELVVLKLDDNTKVILTRYETIWRNYVACIDKVSDTASKIHTYQLVVKVIMATTLLSLTTLFLKKGIK